MTTMTSTIEVHENTVFFEHLCLCRVETLTQLFIFAAGITGWCPVQYLAWAFYCSALIPLIIYFMLGSKSLRHIPAVLEPLMALLQLFIVASLFVLNWTRLSNIHSIVSSNVTDALFQF